MLAPLMRSRTRFRPGLQSVWICVCTRTVILRLTQLGGFFQPHNAPFPLRISLLRLCACVKLVSPPTHRATSVFLGLRLQNLNPHTVRSRIGSPARRLRCREHSSQKSIERNRGRVLACSSSESRYIGECGSRWGL